MTNDFPMNTIDLFFKDRAIPYKDGTKIGDTVSIYPDAIPAANDIPDPFAAAALGVTPIYVTLTGYCVSQSRIPVGAFYMRHEPSGGYLYGTQFKSGETAYG